MSLILGVFASVLIGISDTCGRASARRADSISHVTMQMAVGAVAALPVALVMRSSLIAKDLGQGAVSGVFIALGLAIVYRAMADSSSAIAAPTAAVLGAIIPLAWDLIGGAELTTLAALGCVIALVSLALTTYTPGAADSTRRGLGLAVVGGVFFGLSIAFGADTDPDSGAWPAVAQRGVGFLAMALLASARGVPRLLPPGVRKFGVWGGLAGSLGMICWIIGAQQGDLGVVSVVASTYPAVVAVLATKFDDDTIEPHQVLGIGGAIAGTILIALG